MSLKTIGSKIWDEALWDLIKGVFGVAKGALSERVQEVIKRSPRHDLVFTFLTMEAQDRANLMDAFREYVRQGRENRLVREFGKALPRTPEGKLDEERARRLLKELNSVPEDELQMFLEFLNHDPVAEWFRYWVLGKGKEVAVQASEVLAELAGFGIHISTDESVNDAVLEWRSRKRWWLRRSNRRQRELDAELAARAAEFKVGGTDDDEVMNYTTIRTRPGDEQ